MAHELNFNQLKAFYYAASCRSITLAAEKLFITQPAVSMQIRAMEEEYDAKLFVRRKKKLELTDAGKSLYRIAKEIFTLADQAERLLARSHEALRVGSTKTLVKYVLAGYISRFRKTCPDIQVQIREGSSEEMVESVLGGAVDLAIVGRVQYNRDRLKIVPFARDELVLLAAPSHPLCRAGSVSINDLVGENLILREKGSGTRLLVEKVLERTSIVSSAFIESGNVDFIKELVRIGGGVTLLARMGVDPDVTRGDLKIIPLKEGSFPLDIDVALSRDRTPSPADEAFLSMLLEGTRPGWRSETTDSANRTSDGSFRNSGA
jgi:DNA-binding transcriptional LysR family regulator